MQHRVLLQRASARNQHTCCMCIFYVLYMCMILLSLFNIGVFSTSMQRSVVLVIAGILGSNSPSFLHTQLFCPLRLKGSYIPGFMVGLRCMHACIMNGVCMNMYAHPQ
jgi:hypothetical protein